MEFPMTTYRFRIVFFLLALPLIFLTSCATVPKLPPASSMLAYTVSGNNLLAQYAPVFLIEEPEKDYNHIGTPTVREDELGHPIIFVDPAQPTFYTQIRHWQGSEHTYTNLIYRIHFSEVPFEIIPFYLTAGKNVGLFVIITLDEHQRPVLLTTVHTCGCYLAFLPTSFLASVSLPDDWPKGRQNVYGESLPTILNYPNGSPLNSKIYIYLHSGTHRVADIRLDPATDLSSYSVRKAALKSLAALTKLPAGNGKTLSFFDTEGPRKDYVKDSEKPWERLFLSWLAFDWRVGEDKRLGQDTNDGNVFYTSLKPWARYESDLRNFPAFLHYWGWRLP